MRDAVHDLVHTMNLMKEPVKEGHPITLFTNGMLISGEIIPDWQWFQEQATSPDTEESFMAYVAEKAKQDPHDDLPVNICLKNVHILPLQMQTSPNVRVNMPSNLYWRGRISHVSGWMVGQLTLSSEEVVVDRK